MFLIKKLISLAKKNLIKNSFQDIFRRRGFSSAKNRPFWEAVDGLNLRVSEVVKRIQKKKSSTETADAHQPEK